MSSGVFGKIFGREAVKKASELAVNKTIILKDGTKATIKSVIKAPNQTHPTPVSYTHLRAHETDSLSRMPSSA